jgi:hypothetical protein
MKILVGFCLLIVESVGAAGASLPICYQVSLGPQGQVLEAFKPFPYGPLVGLLEGVSNAMDPAGAQPGSVTTPAAPGMWLAVAAGQLNFIPDGYAVATAKSFVYYRCQTRECPATAIREEAADKSFRDTFLGLRLPPGEQRYFWQEVENLKADNLHQQEHAVASCKLQLAQIDERTSRLTDAYIDRLIDKDVFEQRKTALLSERLQVAAALTSWESGKRNIAEELAEILERANTACLAYETSVVPEKREMVDSLTSNRLLSGKSLEISLTSPFDLIATRSKVLDGSPHRDTHRTSKLLLSRIMKALQRKHESQLPAAS